MQFNMLLIKGKFKQLTVGLLAIVFFASCSVEDPGPGSSVVFDRVVDTLLLTDYSAEQLKGRAGLFGLSQFNDKIQYGGKIYKMSYKTTYKNQEIVASGLVVIPKVSSRSVSVMSVQRGTIFAHREAPSEQGGGLTGVEPIAGFGFMVLQPDMIGFGASNNVVHPYYDVFHSGRAVVDMILASYELAEALGLELTGKHFLTGYSQGGNITIAAQRMIETEYADQIELKGVAAGAGGYDLTKVMRTIFENDTYTYPAFLGFVMHSFNTVNGWNKDYSTVFQAPFDSRIASLYDGSRSGGQINSQLSNNLRDLLREDYLEALLAGTAPRFSQALIDNSHVGWLPQAPLRLYHGTADDIVPYVDTEEAFNSWSARGADVELVSIEGAGHISGFFGMIPNAVEWLDQLDQE